MERIPAFIRPRPEIRPVATLTAAPAAYGNPIRHEKNACLDVPLLRPRSPCREKKPPPTSRPEIILETRGGASEEARGTAVILGEAEAVEKKNPNLYPPAKDKLLRPDWTTSPAAHPPSPNPFRSGNGCLHSAAPPEKKTTGPAKPTDDT